MKLQNYGQTIPPFELFCEQIYKKLVFVWYCLLQVFFDLMQLALAYYHIIYSQYSLWCRKVKAILMDEAVQ